MSDRSLRIGLLMVGHVDPKSRHIAGDYPELFGALLAGLGVELLPYDLDEGRFPTSLRECDGWICSPSRLSAYDPLPWLADAEQLHRDVIAEEVPYVGVCFGHQLLAQALGGIVEKAADGWGVGVRELEVVATRSWMSPASSSRRLALIGSHQDQVTAMPAGAEPLFRADYCPNAGFAVGERAWTIQLHPEFVPELADHLLAGRIELIGAERVAEARKSLDRPLDRIVVARWIAEFFRTNLR
jgi:GMP synthase-like glutamine amidotransferase